MEKLLSAMSSPLWMILMIVLMVIWIIIWYYIWKIARHIDIKRNRDDAIKRSRSAILWELYEKILPFLSNFAYSPKDMVFVWKWFDYLILDWLNDWELKEIIFMEVKYWTSSLNKNEKMIRQAVGSKLVKYVEFKIPKID